MMKKIFNLHYLSKLTILNILLIVVLIFSTQTSQFHQEKIKDRNITMGWQHQYSNDIPRMATLDIDATTDFPSIIQINLTPFSARFESTELLVYLNSSVSNHYTVNIQINHSSIYFIEFKDNVSENDPDLLGDALLVISVGTNIDQYWRYFTPGILLMVFLIVVAEFTRFIIKNQKPETKDILENKTQLVKASWKPTSLREFFKYHYHNFPAISFVVLFLISYTAFFEPHSLDTVGSDLVTDLVDQVFPIVIYGQILLVAIYVLFNFYSQFDLLFQNLTYPISRKTIWLSYIITELLFGMIVQLNYILLIFTYRYYFLLQFSIPFNQLIIYAISSIVWLIVSVLVFQIFLIRLQDWRIAFLIAISVLVTTELLGTKLTYWISFRSILNYFLLDYSGNIIVYLLVLISTVFLTFYISQASFDLVGHQL